MMLSNITTSLTREESNYLRLAHLIIRVSPEAVRKSFDHHFNPGGLQIILMMNKAKIEVLFNKKIINQSQFSTLYPSSTGKCMTAFDFLVNISFFYTTSKFYKFITRFWISQKLYFKVKYLNMSVWD